MRSLSERFLAGIGGAGESAGAFGEHPAASDTNAQAATKADALVVASTDRSPDVLSLASRASAMVLAEDAFREAYMEIVLREAVRLVADELEELERGAPAWELHAP